MRRWTILIPVAVVALVLLMSSIFIVDEREKALVLQFGEIQRVKEEPGVGFKVPLIQEVARYDDRILSLETDPIEVTPSDDRRLVVDAFARYRIADVVQFRQAVGVGGIEAAEDRLESILQAQVRAVLGADGVTSNTILSADRATLMLRIRDAARARAQAIGLDVVDVRLKQTALPEQNLEATFARMRAEREREAADEIARGNEAAQRIRALADRTQVELVSEAEREAEITRGEADAERTGIFAEAFGADQEFFEFYRSLAAYREALREEGTTMVLSPDSQFFEYLESDGGAARASRPAGEGDPVAPGVEGAAATGGRAPEATPPTGGGEEAAVVPAEGDAAEPVAETAGTEEAAPVEEATDPAGAEAEPARPATIFTTADD